MYLLLVIAQVIKQKCCSWKLFLFLNFEHNDIVIYINVYICAYIHLRFKQSELSVEDSEVVAFGRC